MAPIWTPLGASSQRRKKYFGTMVELLIQGHRLEFSGFESRQKFKFWVHDRNPNCQNSLLSKKVASYLAMEQRMS